MLRNVYGSPDLNPIISRHNLVPNVNPFSKYLLKSRHWRYSEAEKEIKKKNGLGNQKLAAICLRGTFFSICRRLWMMYDPVSYRDVLPAGLDQVSRAVTDAGPWPLNFVSSPRLQADAGPLWLGVVCGTSSVQRIVNTSKVCFHQARDLNSWCETLSIFLQAEPVSRGD